MRQPSGNSIILLIAAAVFLLSSGIDTSAAATRDIRDTEITFAVERNLFNDDAVPHNNIDATTTQGIVTLTGIAPTLYAKDRAIEQAQSMKGVRAVIDKIEVKPVIRTDEELAKDVSTALVLDPATDSFEIKATATAGIVTLTGKVQSWAEKNLAQAVAKDVKGVKGIRNEIQLQPKTERADREIEADITQRFKNDVWLTNDQLKVDVNDGVVTLRGTVGSALEKSRATTHAYVLGVKSVDNTDVKVDWWVREHLRRTDYSDRTDEEIKRAVKDAFLYDPRVWSFNPEVEVHFGTVTLTGVVDNLKAKTAAEQDAENTVGVKAVKNYLKVRSEAQPSDQTIADSIRSALLRDPLVDRFEITTTVRNGVTSLYGTVDSYSEKWRAEDVASRVNGVLAVKNHLIVNDYWSWSRDWEIKHDIEDQLWWSPFVDADQVRVSVDDGTATLRGTVNSWWERNMATENAFEGGAKSVRNYLSVITAD